MRFFRRHLHGGSQGASLCARAWDLQSLPRRVLFICLPSILFLLKLPCGPVFFFFFTSCCTRSSKHSLFGRGVNESVHHGMLLWWTVVDASLLLRSLFQGTESSRVCWLLKLISHSKKWGCLETHQAFHMYQQPSSLCWYCPGQRGYRSCGS